MIPFTIYVRRMLAEKGAELQAFRQLAEDYFRKRVDKKGVVGFLTQREISNAEEAAGSFEGILSHLIDLNHSRRRIDAREYADFIISHAWPISGTSLG